MVTLRELPIFQERCLVSTSCERSLVVGDAVPREIWQQNRQCRSRKRYKAVMKQIVGIPFTGAVSRDAEAESEIIDDLITASHCQFDDQALPVADQQSILAHILDLLMDKLKSLIESRVKIYLGSITEQLLDPHTTLAWSATTNNCQDFCNALLQPQLFEPLVHGPPKQLADGGALYVMSFMCPNEGYLQRGVHTKYDVPSGLTEEYLQRFYFGRYDEADVIDTAQEYWYDWGAFGGPLYKYQDLFPWDCTEPAAAILPVVVTATWRSTSGPSLSMLGPWHQCISHGTSTCMPPLSPTLRSQPLAGMQLLSHGCVTV